MVKIKYFFISPLLGKIFNRYTLTKAIIIFILGFISRIFIGTTFGINISCEFCYSFMTFFTVLVSGIIAYFDFCIVPKFIIDLFIGIPKINFNYLELSSIKHAISYYLNRNKVNLTNNNLYYNNSISSSNSKICNLSSSENLSKFDKFKNKGKRKLF